MKQCVNLFYVYTMLTIKEIDFDIRNYLTPAGVAYLDSAFELGAVIAGGFASKVLTAVEKQCSPETFAQILNSYLIFGGDIDLFFPTRERYNQFIELTQNNLGVEYKTPYDIEFLKEYELNSESTWPIINHNEQFLRLRSKYQVIHNGEGSIYELLERFDLKNAMVAINRNKILVNSEWFDLYKSGMLAVHTWANPLKTIRRLGKWAHKHNYDSLTPETESVIKTKLIEALSNKIRDKNSVQGSMDDNILYGLEKLFPSFTSGTLLFLSTLYKNDYSNFDPTKLIKHRSSYIHD